MLETMDQVSAMTEPEGVGIQIRKIRGGFQGHGITIIMPIIIIIVEGLVRIGQNGREIASRNLRIVSVSNMLKP
jgi:hypothetical protein